MHSSGMYRLWSLDAVGTSVGGCHGISLVRYSRAGKGVLINVGSWGSEEGIVEVGDA